MAIDMPSGDIQGFGHVRIVIGLVTGLSVTRILNGLARFVQHPGKVQIYPAHFIWVVFMLLFVTHFWWFQFGLSTIRQWEYPEYAFVIFYAALIFMISSLLFPDQMEEYSGFKEYFRSRARWFYGLLALLFLVDMADSAMKGASHFESLGPTYPIRQSVLAGLALTGMVMRRWTVKFGQQIARNLRRRQARPGDIWHLDEVVVKIAGRSYWLWRAVDQYGVVLEEILQSRRDKRAAKRLLVSLIKRHGFVPKRIVTDKLRSYGAAKREVAPGPRSLVAQGPQQPRGKQPPAVPKA